MSDLAKSIVRSVVPIVVGFGASLLAHVGISQPAVVAAIGSAVAIAYGVSIRLIERKYPKAGVLLGAIGAPTYLSPASVTKALTAPGTTSPEKISLSPAGTTPSTVPPAA